MPDQNSSHGRRPHFQRGRRGSDRRGNERRTPSSPDAAPPRAQVDVEPIMREIRARIAQRHGVDLSTDQIRELAAHRLGAILDPRHVKPGLLDQMRRAAGDPIDVAIPTPPPAQTLDESTLYASSSPVLRFFRRLLRPLLALLFDPAPLVSAVNAQSRTITEASAGDTQRDRRQAEWNALHFQILQQMMLETSRISIEMQNLSARLESLSAKVDFNERRVRAIEGAPQQLQQAQPSRQPREARDAREERGPRPDTAVSAPVAVATPIATQPVTGTSPDTGAEQPRRKRRRRRGRRSGLGTSDTPAGSASTFVDADVDEVDTNGTDTDEGGEPTSADHTQVTGDAPSSSSVIRHSDAEAAAPVMRPPDDPTPVAPVPPTDDEPADR